MHSAYRKISTWVSASVLASTLLMAGNAAADSVTAMCGKSEEVCGCASAKLRSSVGADDYGLYDTVAESYLANKANGAGMADAWDAAVREEADRRGVGFTSLLKQTNALGNAHRKAIKSCEA